MITAIQTPKSRKALSNGIARSLSDKSEGRTDKMLWLDKNEGTDPAYIEIINKILSTIPMSALYGYPDCYPLYQALANYLHTEINQVIIAAGSDGVIRAVYDAYISPGDIVIHPEPTFLMYSVYAKLYEASSLVLDYQPSVKGPELKFETLIAAIKDAKPRLVCLPNPGSPTGTVFTTQELHQIIKIAANVGAVMLVDEAYYPFYGETILPWLSEYPHLIITRTFSKAWGLAGIRLGYGVACRELMHELHKVRPRYEVGSLSAAVAERILQYSDEMEASVARLNQGKHYFIAEMNKLGFPTLASEGNFFHVAFGNYASKIHAVLEGHVLYQKNFKHPSLVGYSRFTTTTQELFTPVIEKIIEGMQQ